MVNGVLLMHMKQYRVDNCAACEPVNRLLNQLVENGFTVVEQVLRDYHFGELYFRVSGDKTLLDKLDTTGFTRKENTFTCECHWSGVEVVAF